MGLALSTMVLTRQQFQSTHPVWDGTDILLYFVIKFCNFNPPIPCGMGHERHETRRAAGAISIHPSRVGWDSLKNARTVQPSNFNPPIPCGMGRVSRILFPCILSISIHPSRVGWDMVSPCRSSRTQISIHPSRVGWDSKKYMITYISCDSYPFCQIFRLHKMTAYSYS